MRVTITNDIGAHRAGTTPDLDAGEARQLVHDGYAVAAVEPAKASTVADIVAAVGDDPALAAQALAAEQAAANPRSTLIDALSAIVANKPTEA